MDREGDTGHEATATMHGGNAGAAFLGDFEPAREVDAVSSSMRQLTPHTATTPSPSHRHGPARRTQTTRKSVSSPLCGLLVRLPKG
jgi:hypothetical protein